MTPAAHLNYKTTQHWRERVRAGMEYDDDFDDDAGAQEALNEGAFVLRERRVDALVGMLHSLVPRSLKHGARVHAIPRDSRDELAAAVAAAARAAADRQAGRVV